VIDRGTNQAKPRRKRAKYLDTRSGRIRLAAIPDNSAGSTEAFVRANVKPGAMPAHGAAQILSGLTDYRHDPPDGRQDGGSCGPAMDSPGLLADQALRARHLSRAAPQARRHLPQLSSDTIGASTGTSRSRPCSGLASHHHPTSYWDIVGRDNPRKGVPTVRRELRRRKAATGMRADRSRPPEKVEPSPVSVSTRQP
jgi:hypothetical protein